MINTHAKPEHFWKSLDHCIAAAMTDRQALIMASQYGKRGLLDAESGALHYVLYYKIWVLTSMRENKS